MEELSKNWLGVCLGHRPRFRLHLSQNVGERDACRAAVRRKYESYPSVASSSPSISFRPSRVILSWVEKWFRLNSKKVS